MSVKPNANEIQEPPNMKSDKTQMKTKATTKTKVLTGVENHDEKKQQSQNYKTLPIKNKIVELPLVTADGPLDGEFKLPSKPGPNEEEVTPTSREPSPSPLQQSPTATTNKILLATLGVRI